MAASRDEVRTRGRRCRSSVASRHAWLQLKDDQFGRNQLKDDQSRPGKKKTVTQMYVILHHIIISQPYLIRRYLHKHFPYISLTFGRQWSYHTITGRLQIPTRASRQTNRVARAWRLVWTARALDRLPIRCSAPNIEDIVIGRAHQRCRVFVVRCCVTSLAFLKETQSRWSKALLGSRAACGRMQRSALVRQGMGRSSSLSNAHLQRCEAIWSRGSKEQTRCHVMACEHNRLPIIIQIDH